jgi:hypothetical protein
MSDLLRLRQGEVDMVEENARELIIESQTG